MSKQLPYPTKLIIYMKKKNYFHEKKYLFSREKIFLFMKKKIYDRESKLLITVNAFSIYSPLDVI